MGESNPEKKVGEFINFLPVLAYDGSAMRQVNAAEILDIAMAGTSATLLAKRWESALLVNVDNETLARLLANKEAMDALMRIEGFRSLNDDIETIINKSEAVKKAKKESDKLTPKQKKELSEEEKEYKSKRKMIQEKLIKFATRVPVFMYLTDYREYSLKDVITQLEPELFKKVTGLNVKDFELLVSLNVFNEALMNDAVYKFKRYEDASLSYTGIDRHAGESIGLYSTVLTRQDYDMMAGSWSAQRKRPPLAQRMCRTHRILAQTPLRRKKMRTKYLNRNQNPSQAGVQDAARWLLRPSGGISCPRRVQPTTRRLSRLCQLPRSRPRLSHRWMSLILRRGLPWYIKRLARALCRTSTKGLLPFRSVDWRKNSSFPVRSSRGSCGKREEPLDHPLATRAHFYTGTSPVSCALRGQQPGQ